MMSPSSSSAVHPLTASETFSKRLASAACWCVKTQSTLLIAIFFQKVFSGHEVLSRFKLHSPSSSLLYQCQLLLLYAAFSDYILNSQASLINIALHTQHSPANETCHQGTFADMFCVFKHIFQQQFFRVFSV